MTRLFETTPYGITREGRLWNEFVARYHYLGYKTLVGTQMRYAVHDRNGWPLAMLGFPIPGGLKSTHRAFQRP